MDAEFLEEYLFVGEYTSVNPSPFTPKSKKRVAVKQTPKSHTPKKRTVNKRESAGRAMKKIKSVDTSSEDDDECDESYE